MWQVDSVLQFFAALFYFGSGVIVGGAVALHLWGNPELLRSGLSADISSDEELIKAHKKISEDGSCSLASEASTDVLAQTIESLQAQVLSRNKTEWQACLCLYSASKLA